MIKKRLPRLFSFIVVLSLLLISCGAPATTVAQEPVATEMPTIAPATDVPVPTLSAEEEASQALCDLTYNTAVEYPDLNQTIGVAELKTYGLVMPNGDITYCGIGTTAESFTLSDGTQEIILLTDMQNFCEQGYNGVKRHAVTANKEVFYCDELDTDPRFEETVLHLADGDYIRAYAPVIGEYYVYASTASQNSVIVSYYNDLFSMVLTNGEKLQYNGDDSFWKQEGVGADVGALYRSFLYQPYVPVSSLTDLDCTTEKPEPTRTYLWRSTPYSGMHGQIPYIGGIKEPGPYHIAGYAPSPLKAKLLEIWADVYYNVELADGTTMWFEAGTASCMP